MSDSFQFQVGRGAIVQTGDGSSGSNGFFMVAGFPQGYRDCALILIDSVHINKQDATTPKDAMNDTHAMYLFGKTFGTCVIKGTAYLGKNGGERGGRLVKEIDSWFKANRVSQSKKPVGVSLAGAFACKVYIESLKFGETNPKINTVAFEITGTVAP